VEEAVDLIIHLRCVLAGKRLFREVAGEARLIENRSKTTDEGVHAESRLAIDSLIRVADVEDLAVVVSVGVVTKLTLVAVEAVADGLVQDGRCV